MNTRQALATALANVPRDPWGYAATGTTSGTRRGHLRLWLHAYSGGRCVCCGLPTVLTGERNRPDLAESGHLVPGGAQRAGYYPGNLATMCRTCNADLGDRVVDPRDLAFPEGVPLEWPDWPTLARMAARTGLADSAWVSSETERRRAARRSAGARW